jgi:thymidine phosphorylase
MLRAQGADLAALAARLERDHAPVVTELKATSHGFVKRSDARIIGEAVRDLGAGRMTQEDAVDFDVGVDRIAAVGQQVGTADTLCRVHARTTGQAEQALRRLETAFEISSAPVKASSRIVEVL